MTRNPLRGSASLALALLLALLSSTQAKEDRPNVLAERARSAAAEPTPVPDWDPRPLTRWDSFTASDGLPDNKVLAVRADGDSIWAGTEKGLARYQDGKWTTFGVREGLPHAVVLSLDVCPQTGDLWIGTMGGLARFSAGRIDAFRQTTSGLSNDFVNDVECDPDEPHVWAATAMGASRLDLRSGAWTVFTEENTPMREPWTYSVAIDKSQVWIGAWGAGVLEMDKTSGRWREYHDPDEEMEIDLLRDDGPVHDVTSSVDFRAGVLWQASYFGLARYEGRHWRSYFKEDSPLVSNFINFVRARGRVAWLATDDGLSATDGERWATYLKSHFVLGVDFRDDEVWAATENGLLRGRR